MQTGIYGSCMQAAIYENPLVSSELMILFYIAFTYFSLMALVKTYQERNEDTRMFRECGTFLTCQIVLIWLLFLTNGS